MAKQIVRFEELTDYDRGITCSVGLVEGGTAVNVVPEFCSAIVDMRVVTAEDADEMTNKILGFEAFDPKVGIEISGGANRPPYEKIEQNMALFDHAKGLAAEVGFELKDTFTGGGSDGNFTSAIGVPTLDGLGVDGSGAHTQDEYLTLSSLVPRTKLLIRLFETLE